MEGRSYEPKNFLRGVGHYDENYESLLDVQADGGGWDTLRGQD